MMYVGLDVHKEWTTVAALDPETGELAEFARVPNRREAFAVPCPSPRQPKGSYWIRTGN
jgi:hypothetical protein